MQFQDLYCQSYIFSLQLLLIFFRLKKKDKGNRIHIRMLGTCGWNHIILIAVPYYMLQLHVLNVNKSFGGA
jgi:hypothetical protein